jgi:hypothetical protein
MRPFQKRAGQGRTSPGVANLATAPLTSFGLVVFP